MIDFYRPRAKVIAAATFMRLPRSVQLDELESAAIEGLWHAIEKFNRHERVKFETFADYRIKGAMMDWLRLESNRSRNMINAARVMESAGEMFFAVHGRNQTREEVAASATALLGPHITKRAMSPEGIGPISFSTIGMRNSRSSLENITQNSRLPYTQDRTDQHLRLRSMSEHLFLGLNELQRSACRLYFVECLTMLEIGRRIGKSESRVSQILQTAIKHIRGRFTRGEVEELMA